MADFQKIEQRLERLEHNHAEMQQSFATMKQSHASLLDRLATMDETIAQLGPGGYRTAAGAAPTEGPLSIRDHLDGIKAEILGAIHLASSIESVAAVPEIVHVPEPETVAEEAAQDAAAETLPSAGDLDQVAGQLESEQAAAGVAVVDEKILSDQAVTE